MYKLLLWCGKWINVEKKPTEIMMDILDTCDAKFYPNIDLLVNILATLPASITAIISNTETLKNIAS